MTASRIIASGDAHPIPPIGGNPPRADHEAQRAATTLINVEGIASDAFNQIEAVANLALMAMETPKAISSQETFAQALLVIRGLAQEAFFAVSGEAERVVKLVEDDAADRRHSAWRAGRALLRADESEFAR